MGHRQHVPLECLCCANFNPVGSKGKPDLHRYAAQRLSRHGAPYPDSTGYDETRLYGLAIDLGSTTIAAHLTDLRTGEVAASSGIMAKLAWRRPDTRCHSMMNLNAEMTNVRANGPKRADRPLSAEADQPNQIMEAVLCV
jgi:hypothetical protein